MTPNQPDLSTTSVQQKRASRSFSLLAPLFRTWNNLSLQVKLVLLMTTVATLPVLLVTQQLTKISAERFFNDLKESLREKATILREEYVLWNNQTAVEEAKNIGQSIQEANLNLSRAEELVNKQELFNNLLRLPSQAPPEEIMSFKIVTDRQGKTIAQSIQVLSDNFDAYPQLPPQNGSLVEQKYQTVSLPTGINLGDVSIVKEALEKQQALAGVELLKAESLQRLGLDRQAAIGIRSQVVKGLAEAKQPSPEGTFDIDNGKAGLVSIAVHPIKINGRLVGTAVVGSLLNRNYNLIDKFQNKYPSVSVVTLFAKDWRVSTNVPYVDPQTNAPDRTRALGTRVSRQVANTVLERGQEFIGQTNIVGVNYLTAYIPLYDYQKQLNSETKPIGMVFVGKSLTEIDAVLRSQQLVGYGIAGGIWLLTGIIAFPIATSLSRPLKDLADRAQKIGAGEQGVSIYISDRQDEIGKLSNSLHYLLEQLAAKEEVITEEIARTVKLEQDNNYKIQLNKENELIQLDIGHILEIVSAVEEGDLTIQAEVSDRATGLVADTLNRLIEELARIMSVVLSTAQQVTQGAEQLEKLAVSTTEQVEQQANSVMEVQSLMENVNKLSQDTAQQALWSDEAVQQAQNAIDQGQQQMLSMGENIKILQQGTDQIVRRTQNLTDFVTLAAQFTQDQKRVAALTRVLALNASTIATRASEQQDPEQFASVAREFATIATQVNDLAVQTNQSLVTLKQKTDQIQTVVSGLEGDIEEISGSVDRFTSNVDSSRQVFDNIKTVTEKVSHVGQEVTKSSVAIASVAETTLEAIHSIATAAAETERSSRYTLQQAGTIDRLARTLYSRVSFFRISENIIDELPPSSVLPVSSLNSSPYLKDGEEW
jgi:methyl-accepting chemotaxis protein